MRPLPLKKILFGYFFSFVFLFIFASNASAQQPTLNFTATSGSTGTVNLSWTMLPYVENYNIAYGPLSGHYLYGINGVGNVGHYTIGGLTPGQTYYFVLSPVDDGSAMAFSAPVSAAAGTGHASPPVTGGTGGADHMVHPPTASGGNDEDKNFHLSATSGPHKGSVTLHWDNKGYIDTYNIAYGPNPGNYIWGISNVGHVGHYTIGGLTPGQTYYFVLSPVDGEVALPFTPYVAATAAN